MAVVPRKLATGCTGKRYSDLDATAAGRVRGVGAYREGPPGSACVALTLALLLGQRPTQPASLRRGR